MFIVIMSQPLLMVIQICNPGTCFMSVWVSDSADGGTQTEGKHECVPSQKLFAQCVG